MFYSSLQQMVGWLCGIELFLLVNLVLVLTVLVVYDVWKLWNVTAPWRKVGGVRQDDYISLKDWWTKPYPPKGRTT